MSIENAGLYIEIMRRWDGKVADIIHTQIQFGILSGAPIPAMLDLLLDTEHCGKGFVEREPYVSDMLRTYLLANFDSQGVAIAGAVVAHMEKSNEDVIRQLYPAVIDAIVNACIIDRNVTTPNLLYEEKLPYWLGEMFIDYIDRTEDCPVKLSTWAISRLSDTMHNFIDTSRRSRELAGYLKPIDKIPECLHPIFNDLTHRLFGRLSFADRIKRLTCEVA